MEGKRTNQSRAEFPTDRVTGPRGGVTKRNQQTEGRAIVAHLPLHEARCAEPATAPASRTPEGARHTLKARASRVRLCACCGESGNSVPCACGELIRQFTNGQFPNGQFSRCSLAKKSATRQVRGPLPRARGQARSHRKSMGRHTLSSLVKSRR